MPVFSSARRADEFEALLDGGGNKAEYAELLDLAARLRAVPPVEPRADFSASLRERLLAEAETALVPVARTRSTTPSPTRRRERRVAALVGGLTLVGATSGVAMASQSALPGDPLYGVKRALENAHTQLVTGDADKGQLLLSDARGRLSEVAALAREGGSASEITDALTTFSRQADQGSALMLADYTVQHDASSVAAVRDFTGSSVVQLAGLDGRIPAAARPALLKAASQVFAIDTRAQALCPSCGGAGVTSVPPNLVSQSAAVSSIGPPAMHATATQGPGPKGQPAPVQQPAAGPSAPQVSVPSAPISGGVPDPQAPASELPNPVKSLQNLLTASAPAPSVPDPGSVVSSLKAPVDSAVGGLTSELPQLP